MGSIRRRTAVNVQSAVRRLPIAPGTVWGWLSVLPVLVLYIIIAVLPVMFALWASLHNIPITNPNWEFVGLSNYGTVLELGEFWGALYRGILFMTGSTLVQLIAGVWFALVLNKMARGGRFLSALVINAYLTPLIVVVFIFFLLLDPFVGLLHTVGVDILGLWDGSVLGDPSLAMPVVILVGSWKFSAFVTIFTLAQLQSIPERYYEAAKVCGANSWQMFRDVTLPRISGAILIAVFLRAIFMFNKFDVIWMMTYGGPGKATTTLPIYAYETTFIDGDFGLGVTVAVFMFITLALGGIVYLKLAKPESEIET